MKINTAIGFFKKHNKVLLLGLIGLVIFHDFIPLIIVALLLGFIGLASLKVTRMVPHISIETISASAVLIGYMWGWKFGLFFGLAFGLYGYASISFLQLKSIINLLLMGLCGVIAAIFASLGYTFVVAYMGTFIIRMILNNVIFPLVESNMMENLIHGFGDPLFNMLITFQIMNLIYGILQLL